MVEKLAALVVDRDLDAALRVLTKGRVGAREDAPVSDVERITRGDLDRAEVLGGRQGPPPAGEAAAGEPATEAAGDSSPPADGDAPPDVRPPI